MKTKKLTYTAFFIALGIVLPQLFHLIGGPFIGAMLLPMHIPVLLGAILLGPVSGLIIGLSSVLIGFFLGMPTLPIAAFMFFELGAYGLVAGYLGYTKKMNVYITLVIAMLAGRIVSLVAMKIAIILFKVALPPVFGTVAIFSAGIPGVIVQLIVIPALIYASRRYLHVDDKIRTS